jgi:hypothetical protein
MKFEPNPKGCIEAKNYLISLNLYNKVAQRMDGYALVFHANTIYESKKKEEFRKNHK